MEIKINENKALNKTEWYKDIKPHKYIANTQKFTNLDLDILARTVPEAVLIPFTKFLLALCEDLGYSGQNAGSDFYTVGAILQAVKKILLQEPICDVTIDENEWVDVSEMGNGSILYKKNTCYDVFNDWFNDWDERQGYYLNLIVWKGVEDYDRFRGRVYIDDKYFELIRGSQFVKLPFKPKTFIIPVFRIPISKEEVEKRDLHYIQDEFNECYYALISQE
jgi:hypothetical protein